MDDYISREAAIEIVINYEFENCPDYIRDFATKLKSAVCSDIRADLQALPAVDIPIMARARWLYVSDGYGVCSNCNRGDHIDPKSRYCRYCGARIMEAPHGKTT